MTPAAHPLPAALVLRGMTAEQVDLETSAIDAAEVARRLGVSLRSVREATATGHLRSFTFGRARRYTLAAVFDFVRRNGGRP